MDTNNLVYLDHSTIVVLERALKRNAGRFEQFVETWRARNCTLMISMVHALEISQSKHADAREYRVRVLERLWPARIGLVPSDKVAGPLQNLEGREILSAIGRKIGQTEVIDALARGALAFPVEIPDGQTGAVMRSLVSGRVRRTAKQFQEAVKVGANAQTSRMRIDRLRYRLRDLPSGATTPDQSVAAQASIEELLGSKEWDNELSSAVPARYRSEVNSAVRGWLTHWLQRTTELGPREAFAEHVKAELPSALKEYTDDLIVRYTFREAVENVATDVLRQTDPHTIKDLAQSVTLEDCPGTWLRRAVERELRQARSTWKPGAEYDLMHIAHLPYVDVLFCDGEMANNTAKVLRRSGLPPGLENVGTTRSAEDSIEAVEEALPQKRP